MDKKKRRLVIRTIILLLLAAALVYTLYINFFTSKDKVAVGDMAPDFVVTDLNGNEHHLSEYRGEKGVFLNFWGTWCEPCQREFPYIDTYYQEYKDQGVEVIAINVGEPKFSVNNFIKKYDLSFPVAIDKGNQLLNAYGIDPLPTTLLIDKDGKVVKIITGEMTSKMVRDYMEQIKP
ncbi:thiol-disulfide oxidoreductase ResA [Fredinandcohnia sp. QZ13]|uniref:thiol-disulfide oxidoreductase ResA n=1 Tax=Fredinandcohnia sp. QZ13 TaxID=3073144 RepID=UPI002853637B|nr:thiol-disulfide oxidoreductase ResA [Fredinandcohnia sp. QZ13]MDR4888766.1 thiol-disulfide oxidoreductase ResA [Fredinandcohnia sp. QZ13]